MKKINDMSFSELSQQLEEIVMWFESEDVDLDIAVEKFEYGMNISRELQKRLKQTEQKIQKLSSS